MLGLILRNTLIHLFNAYSDLLTKGEPLPAVLMSVIRFIMPHKSKALKKLLFLYWELLKKVDDNGKLLQVLRSNLRFAFLTLGNGSRR
jgi:hypothetical protein